MTHSASAVQLGKIRCSPLDATFRTAGPYASHALVFHRTAVWLRRAGTPPFVADPTRVTFYNPGTVYERRPLDAAGDRSDWLVFAEPAVREVVSVYDPAAGDGPADLWRHTHAPVSSELYFLHRQLHEYATGSAAPDALLVEEAGLRLLDRALRDLYRGASMQQQPLSLNARHRALAEHVCAFLNATINETHDLCSIARSVGTSVFHLCRVFRRVTGFTVHAYRHHLRLRRALSDVEAATDLLALALDLGYSSHSHFTVMFRRQFGLPPSELRACAGAPHRRALFLLPRRRRVS